MKNITFIDCLDTSSAYESEEEWRMAHPLHYKRALLKNWLKEIIEVNDYERKEKWRLARCQADALKYPTRRAWKESKSLGYHAAARRSWLHLCPHDTNSKIEAGGLHHDVENMTFEDCLLIVSQYKFRVEWLVKSPQTYDYAVEKGWTDLCFLVLGQQIEAQKTAAEPLLAIEQFCTKNRPSLKALQQHP